MSKFRSDETAALVDEQIASAPTICSVVSHLSCETLRCSVAWVNNIDDDRGFVLKLSHIVYVEQIALCAMQSTDAPGEHSW